MSSHIILSVRLVDEAACPTGLKSTQPKTHVRRQLGSTLPYDHLFWTHLSNSSASVSWRKVPLCHISKNLVLTKKKLWWKKHRYTCRLYTRGLLYLQYLYPRKYMGHVYIQYFSPNYSRAPPQKLLNNELNKPMKRVTSTNYYRLQSMSVHYYSIFESSIIN